MSARSLGIYMLDVGQGDATVIVPPAGEGEPVVFDCRDDQVVHKLLTHWGRTDLEAVIVSHLDLDHIAGVEQLLRRSDISTQRLYLSADRDISDDHPDAKMAKQLVDYAIEGDRQQRWELFPTLRPARPILTGKDWSIELLAPRSRTIQELEREGRWEDPNVLSGVLRVEMGENVVLIGGDAPLLTWAELDERGEADARVFRIPHHGGALSDGGVPLGWSAQRLYEAVGPEVSTISVGTLNSHGHPSREWVEPACARCRLLCTQVTERCQAGIRDDIEGFRDDVVAKAALVEADWWHLADPYGFGKRKTGVPCAGTIVVTLYEKQLRVRPMESKHHYVVQGWDQALCAD